MNLDIVLNKKESIEHCIKQIRQLALLGLLCLFVLSACTKQIKSTPVEVKQDASLEELLSLYQQRLKMNAQIKALVKVDADLGPRGRHTIQATWSSSQEQIHLRGFNLFGGTLFELDVAAASFSLKTPSDPQAFEADLDFYEEVAGRQIPFGSLDLLRWVQRGGLPDTTFPKIPVIEKGEDVFVLYLFTLFEGRAILEEKVFIERTAFRVTRVELFEHTGLRNGVIELNEYRVVDGREFPFSVKGTSGSEVMRLTFKEVSFPSPAPGKIR